VRGEGGLSVPMAEETAISVMEGNELRYVTAFAHSRASKRGSGLGGGTSRKKGEKTLHLQSESLGGRTWKGEKKVAPRYRGSSRKDPYEAQETRESLVVLKETPLVFCVGGNERKRRRPRTRQPRHYQNKNQQKGILWRKERNSADKNISPEQKEMGRSEVKSE